MVKIESIQTFELKSSSPNPARPNLFNTVWFALAFFLLAAIAFSWPMVLYLPDSLPDWGDPADSSWRLGALAQNLANNPFDLYNTSAFYPIKNGLALDELLTGQALLAAPVIWLTNNPVLAFNLLIFLSYLLSGFSMWLLVRHLTGSSAGGLVAGLIYAFSPWHYSHHSHLGLSSQQWMIFGLYFLIRFLESSRLRFTMGSFFYLALFGLMFWLQALVAGYYAYFAAILFGFYLAYYFGFERGLLKIFWQSLRRQKPTFDRAALIRQIGGLAIASFFVLLLLIPFVQPFIEAQGKYSFKRDLAEAAYWSAAPTSFLRTTDRSWLYKPVQRGVFKLQTSAERALYPGLVAVILAVLGLALAGRLPAARRRWLFFGLSLSGLLLSFGPTFHWEAYGLQSSGFAMPYRFFYQYVPGFDALRVPQRFGQLFMLGLAVCAGYGAAALLRHPSKPPLLPSNLPDEILAESQPPQKLAPRKVAPRLVAGFSCLLMLGLLTADYIAPNLPVQPTRLAENAPPLYKWLAAPTTTQEVPKDALLVELPLSANGTPVNTNPLYLVYNLQHKRPMLNGSANIIPAGYERLVREMLSFPNTATLDIMEGLGVQFVIVHTDKLPADANRQELEKVAATPANRLELVRQFDTQKIYRVKKNPDRFKGLENSLPEGSRVLLCDNEKRSKLYTAVLPRLLAGKRQYFKPYTTIYDSLPGNLAGLPRPNQIFDYAVLYKGTDKSNLAELHGKNLQLVGGNEIVEVYKIG